MSNRGEEDEAVDPVYAPFSDILDARSGGDRILELVKNLKEFQKIVNATKIQLRKSPDARKEIKRRNFPAIQLVELSRIAWEGTKDGEVAPALSLNPASAFGRFLSELFDATGIKGDPRAAFKAWRKLQ